MNHIQTISTSDAKYVNLSVMAKYFFLLPLVLIAVFISSATLCLAYNNDPYMEFLGTCDASGAVSLDGDSFVVAGDEINVLKIYSSKHPAEGRSIDLSKLVSGVKSKTELDLEAGTKVGDTTFWISSHSRSKKKGAYKPERHILFALKFEKRANRFVAKPIGKPYKKLLKEIVKSKVLKKYDFEDFSKKKSLLRACESKRGFNIEGLTVWQGNKLLIGLRGPQYKGNAILIPLMNPFEVINGGKPKFADIIKLDLKGLGIRGIDYVPALKSYIILAGNRAKYKDCQVYLWSGKKEDSSPKRLTVPKYENRFNPEAVFAFPNSKVVWILSDDGNQRYSGIKCKVLEKEGKLVFFRAMKLDLKNAAK